MNIGDIISDNTWAAMYETNDELRSSLHYNIDDRMWIFAHEDLYEKLNSIMFSVFIEVVIGTHTVQKEYESRKRR